MIGVDSGKLASFTVKVGDLREISWADYWLALRGNINHGRHTNRLQAKYAHGLLWVAFRGEED